MTDLVCRRIALGQARWGRWPWACGLARARGVVARRVGRGHRSRAAPDLLVAAGCEANTIITTAQHNKHIDNASSA